MLKVLSTKLTVDEVDRFATMAEKRGESKSGLLKRLTVDHMNDVAKVAGVASVGNPHPAAPSKKDLVKGANHVDSLPSSTESLPVNQGASKGRPETSPKSSMGKGLLLLASIFLLWPKPQPSSNTGDQPVFDSSSPYLDAYGEYTSPT